jgi:hypothetical protein
LLSTISQHPHRASAIRASMRRSFSSVENWQARRRSICGASRPRPRRRSTRSASSDHEDHPVVAEVEQLGLGEERRVDQDHALLPRHRRAEPREERDAHDLVQAREPVGVPEHDGAELPAPELAQPEAFADRRAERRVDGLLPREEDVVREIVHVDVVDLAAERSERARHERLAARDPPREAHDDLLVQAALERLLDDQRDVLVREALVATELLGGARADVRELPPREEHVRVDAALLRDGELVHHALVVVVRRAADTLHDHREARLVGVVGEELVLDRAHLHAGIAERVPHEARPLLQAEHVALGGVVPDDDAQRIERPPRAAHDVEVAEGDGIEAARVDGACHRRSLPDQRQVLSIRSSSPRAKMGGGTETPRAFAMRYGKAAP